MLDPTRVALPAIPTHKTAAGRYDPTAVLWDWGPAAGITPAAGDVIFDPDVQREFREAHAKAIASDWNPALADPTHLSVRADGTEAIIDGAHTAWAAKDNGVKSLPAIRHFDLTLAQEAAFHLRHQSARRADSATDKWNLRIRAGVPEYVDAEAMLARYGLQVGSQIRAAGAIDYVVATFGAEALERVVICMNAWARAPKAGREDWTANAVIRALGWLFGHHPLVADPTQLGRKLQKKTTPVGMAGHVAAIAKGGGGSGSRTTIGAREIAKIWNTRRAPTNQYPIGVVGVEVLADEDEDQDEDDD